MRFIFLNLILLAGYFVVFRVVPTDAEETFLATELAVYAGDAAPASPKIDPNTLGGKLFMENCARCHSPNLTRELTGPALWGVAERVDREKLGEWIRNSAKVLATGDPYFLALQKRYNGAEMDPMPHLKPAEIEAIIDEISMAGR